MTGGNTYVDCGGVGVAVVRVHEADNPPRGVGRPGNNGTGECAACGRIVSQRGAVASRHADKGNEER